MLLLTEKELRIFAEKTRLLDNFIAEFLEKLRLAFRDVALDDVEIRILELWLKGKSYKQIGEEYVKIYGRKRPYSKGDKIDKAKPYNPQWIRYRLSRVIRKLIRKLDEYEKKEKETHAAEAAKITGATDITQSIKIFEFSVRTDNVLREGGVKIIADLISKTESELLLMKNMGRKSLNEIKEVLATYGLKLKTG